MSILKSLKKALGEPAAAPASATDLLRADHKKVKGLFDEFESSEEAPAKRRLVESALVELTVHAKLEEELFYPAVRKRLDESGLVDEAEEEHHVAKILIGELAGFKKDAGRFEAKFKVLAENVRHHIEEEEYEMFAKIEKADIDLESLGQEMRERKLRLIEEVTLDSIREESSIIIREEAPSGGRRSRRASRGAKSRRMNRSRARAKAGR